ncbi:hypothetical protein ES702_01463 [subsurface metagenome]
MGILEAINILRGIFPPPLDIILSLNMYMMFVLMIYIVIDKIRKMNAIRTLVIYKDYTHEIKDFIPKNDKLKIKDGWEPRFDSQSIIPVKRRAVNSFKFIGFKQKNLVIAIEDLSEVVSLRGIEGESVADKVKDIPKNIQSKILNQWTREEFKIWLKKTLAKAQTDRKLFGDQQFYIFVGLLFINMMILIMIAQRMGVI